LIRSELWKEKKLCREIRKLMKETGYFIAFEGIDGSGKSSIIKLLDLKLKENKITAYLTKEPTDGPFGSLIHQFMTGRLNADHRAIAAMFAADRIDHLTNTVNGIKQIINNGITVISDRYYFSSYAYHCVFADMDWVINANKICYDILKPDLNIFIDTDPEICMKRIEETRFIKEKYEELEHLKKVRNNYFAAFDRLSHIEKVAVINGNRTAEEIANDVLTVIEKTLPELGAPITKSCGT
jgi:dTMP kinase